MTFSTPRTVQVLLLFSFMIGGCQSPDARVECARLTAALETEVRHIPKPDIPSDPDFPSLMYSIRLREYYAQPHIQIRLRQALQPYAQLLKTESPVSFCSALTGKDVLPEYVDDPFKDY